MRGMMGRGILAIAVALLCGSAAADAPARSVPPAPKPAGPMVEVARLAPFDLSAASPFAVAVSPRPLARPGDIVRRFTGLANPIGRIVPAMAQRPAGGGLCGTSTVEGEAMTRIPGRIPGCGIDAPVRVRAVGGVALSPSAVMDCRTAAALERWVQRGLKPAVGQTGGGVTSLRVAAHYACRTRNNRPGGRLSEHAKGRAIDISGIRLANGATLDVLTGWRDPGAGPILRRAHRAACGPFGTVLGPEADRFHQNHFHFDTARYRSGTYCR